MLIDAVLAVSFFLSIGFLRCTPIAKQANLVSAAKAFANSRVYDCIVLVTLLVVARCAYYQYILIEFTVLRTVVLSLNPRHTKCSCRWAKLITHVPCGGAADYPAGRLLITSTLEEIDGVDGVLGFAGPSNVWGSCNTISAVGYMAFDIDDIDSMEDAGVFETVILHEMGHVIGVG